jgi:hypothetical protein
MRYLVALAIAGSCIFGNSLKAQFGGRELDGAYFEAIRTISTAVPIMAVSPDARAGGMGDVGVASDPDALSIYWNTAKLAQLGEGYNSLAISYTPWLDRLVNDINLAHVSYAVALDDRQGLAFSLRYFSLGEIIFKDEFGTDQGTGQPYEFTLNGAYGLKLSENFSVGVGIRWIFSDLTNGFQTGGIQATPGQTVAADLGLYYRSNKFSTGQGQFQSYALGLNISNIGGKITYGNTSQESADFIPANMRLGGAYNLQFDKYNRLSFMVDFNKLLVPTPPVREGDSGFRGDINGNGEPDDGSVIEGKDNQVSSFAGALQSFNDAPGGFREELEEVIVNVGLEYWYDNRIAFRGGYQYEDEQKGRRQYYTIGFGIKYNIFGLDFAYLIPATELVTSPLENTLRFTLFFNFGSAN